MSLMGSLYVGAAGLRTSQNGLHTTAHNLTNADTEGYVRQQVVQTDFGYNTIGRTALGLNQVGLGVDTLTVKQARDIFLDKSYRLESGRQGFYESQFEAADEIQQIMGEIEGVQFQTELNDFWVALQEMAKEPESIVTRATLIQSAVSFMERAESISIQIEEYQLNLNQNIHTQVDRINEIADRIKELNEKISFYEAGVENANDYRDERNMLLDELGSFVNITSKELPNGVVTVMAEQMPLVAEDRVFHMGTRTINETSPMLTACWPCYNDMEVFNFDRTPSPAQDTDIGSLKGLILARGSKIGKACDIPIAPKEADYTDENGVLNEAEYKKAMVQFEKEREAYNRNIDSSIITSTQAQFDQLIHGIATTVNDIICPNKEIEIEVEVTVEKEDGTTTTEKQKKMIKVLDEENAPVGMDEDVTMGVELFSRKSMSRYTEKTEVTLANGEKAEVYIYNEEDPKNNYSLYTLGELEVNPEILKDRSKLPLSENKGTGDFDIKTTERLLSAWQEEFAALSPNELDYQNFTGYYTALVGAIGTKGEMYDTMAQNQSSLVNGIQNGRLSVMAVSTDEELTYLIKYQHAYNASARYVNVVNEMLEHILSNL